MSLFVGIKLAPQVNDAIATAVAEMRESAAKQGLKVNWVPPRNLHVTLKFLGFSDTALLEPLNAELAKAAAQAHPFDLGAQGTGYFPPRGQPRVLWVGLDDSTGALAKLAAEIETRLTPLGFEPETRAFSAHLTVARVKEGKHAAPVLAPFAKSNFGTSRIDRLLLFDSVTSPAGSQYSIISEHTLG